MSSASDIAREASLRGASNFRTHAVLRAFCRGVATVGVMLSLSRLRALAPLAALTLACGEATPEPYVCSVTAPTACVEPAPTYDDVAPIFAKRCTSCHDGKVDGPWPLTSYEHISGWWDVVRDELVACAMPPPGEGVIMTNEEREKILMWLRCGYRE